MINIFNIIVEQKEPAIFYNFYVVKLYLFTIQQNILMAVRDTGIRSSLSKNIPLLKFLVLFKSYRIRKTAYVNA